MLALLACSAALVAAHGGPAVSDEVVLLQQLKTQAQQPLEDQFELICDPDKGCHYLLHTSSTPVPYQLVCDEANGCHYTGVTPPPKEQASPFQMPNPGLLQLLMSQSEAKGPQPSLPQPNLQPPPQMAGKSAGDSPDPNPMRLMQLSSRTQRLSGQALMERWSREFQGAFDRGAHFLRPNITNAKWLLRFLVPEEEPKEPQAFFIPDNGMCCVQGPTDYIREKLAKLKESPIGAGYVKAEVTDGLCESKGYDRGSEEKCFPKARLYMSRLHPINPLSEPMLMAKYAKKHGIAAAKDGMLNLCAP